MSEKKSTPASVALRLASLKTTDRVLVVIPGRAGETIAQELLSSAEFSQTKQAVFLDASLERLQAIEVAGAKICIKGSATRLPFLRHRFEVILAFQALYSIRPPWTVLAEFHRVLVPDGKLILLEPARHGVFSTLRDKIAGPGRRIFELNEVCVRLKKAGFEQPKTEAPQKLAGMPYPAWCLSTLKQENAAEPAPDFTTAKEMIEKRQLKIKNEQ